MDIKRIMLITFLLLAVLAIGTVSASDSVASDGLNASDDSDIMAVDNQDALGYDEDEHFIDVNTDEIILDENNEDYDEDDIIASITLPDNTKKGSFQILNGNDVVVCLNVDTTDDDHWEKDSGILEGIIYLSDFNLTKVHNDDVLSFVFFENTGGTPVDFFTKEYKVSLTDSTMKFIRNDGGMMEEDVDIQVSNIDPSKPDKNFTHVNVAQKDGFFIISVDCIDGSELEIFKENLKTTERPYVMVDKNGTQFYRFGFSFTDLNNYIAQNISGVDNFSALVNSNIIDGNDIYFGVYEEDDLETDIGMETLTFTISPNGKILFSDDEDDENVDVDYAPDLDIIMYEGWQESEVVQYTVKKGIVGKIVIYLNDNETPAFEKYLSQLTPAGSDDESNEYIITVRDLNITRAGKYIIRDYIDYENGTHIYQYDVEDPEVLELFEPQNITADNVTIYVDPIPKSIGDNETLITIYGFVGDDDVVVIYVDENSEPITIRLGDCGKDNSGNYIIRTDKLNLDVGKHNLNITCKGVNLTAEVELISNLVIYIPDENEIVYTTFNEGFVFISLDEENIYTSNIEGKINLTIMDGDGNVINTLQKDIKDLNYDNRQSAYTIRTGDVDAQLNGTYKVVVRYFDGNKGTNQTEGNVTFKSFAPEDYGASINNALKEGNDYLIKFNNVPRDYNILVETDGNETAEFKKSDLITGVDQEKIVYYIKYNQLKGLTDGFHSIKVCLVVGVSLIDLASGNVFVDVVENIDPSLTIAVANIEEGSTANVVITTNSTFTGEVIVQVANKNYTVSVVKGQGNISIAGLTPNTYTATAFFKSNEIFNGSNKTATFEVTSKPVVQDKKQEDIKLTLKKVKIRKSARKLVLQATLKINGKSKKDLKVIFKFKGKKYTAKTNSKGVAKVIIKKKVLRKLKVNKRITYQAKYLDNTVKRTVKIKK